MRALRSDHRQAFTLMEIIIVVMIFLIIAAISIPTIQSTLDDSRVTASGDAVRGKLAEARARAMEEGRTWKFAFIANTGIYQLAPEDSPEWETPSQELDERPDLIRDSLPPGVVFGLSHEDIFNNDTAGQAGAGWEIAAVFTPDGAAVDDALFYFGKPGQAPMRARLRGLTGSVSIETFKAGGTP